MQHIGPRRPRTGIDRSGWPWAAPGALLVALLAGLVNIPGCLNPRPEEDPSSQLVPVGPEADNPGPAPAQPERESCDDNPLLAGCESPSQGGVSAPDDADEPPASAAPETPAPAEPVDAGGGLTDAGSADAGAPPGSSVAE